MTHKAKQKQPKIEGNDGSQKNPADKIIACQGQQKEDHINPNIYPRVTIKVDDVLFETRLKTLERFPNTLLGDPLRRQHYYNKKRNEYVLDRDPDCFDAILYFYQSGGKLKKPLNVPILIFLDEVRFYDLGEEVFYELLKIHHIPKKIKEVVPKNETVRKIWRIVEKPESSIKAKVFVLFSTLVTVVAIVMICEQTLPQKRGYNLVNLTNMDGKKSFKFQEDIYMTKDIHTFVLERICMIWFVLELLIRFLVSPEKRVFFFKFLNVVDLISILPFFYDILSLILKDNFAMTKNEKFISAIRAVRLFRFLLLIKVSGQTKLVKSLMDTVVSSIYEIFLSIYFMCLCVVMFACLLYTAEHSSDNSENQFHSIPGGFWWGVITMTLVGYGDQVPNAPIGKLVASVCAITGAFTAAFFVPAIAANFTFILQRGDGLATSYKDGLKNTTVGISQLSASCEDYTDEDSNTE